MHRQGGRGLFLSFFCAALLSAACTQRRADDEPALPRQQPLELKSLPAAVTPGLRASELAPSVDGFALSPRKANRASRLSVELPASARGRARLASKRSDTSLTIESEDAVDARGQLVDGAVVYRGAALDTDVVAAAHGDRYEELRVLRSARAPTVTRYRLSASRGTWRANRGGAELVDGGTPVFRSLPAYAIDANGKRRALQVELEAHGGDAVLVTKLDTTGLSFPVTVDPTWVYGSAWPNEVVVALNSTWLKQGGDTTGDVAVIDVSPGPVLTDDAEGVVGESVVVTGTVSANRVRIRQGGSVHGDVRTNTLTNGGTVTGSVITPLSLPLSIAVPAVSTFTPGTTDVILAQHEDLTLAPGAYAARASEWGQLLIIPTEGYLEAPAEGPIPLRDVAWVEISTMRVRGGMAGRPRQMMDITDEILPALQATQANWEFRESSWSIERVFDEEPVRVIRVLNPFCAVPELTS
jgi:hypothetical protein